MTRNKTQNSINNKKLKKNSSEKIELKIQEEKYN